MWLLELRIALLEKSLETMQCRDQQRERRLLERHRWGDPILRLPPGHYRA